MPTSRAAQEKAHAAAQALIDTHLVVNQLVGDVTPVGGRAVVAQVDEEQRHGGHYRWRGRERMCQEVGGGKALRCGTNSRVLDDTHN